METIPPTRTPQADSSTASPFPAVTSQPLAPIFGREEEIRQVTELIDRDTVRVVTLLGPGGVGKTRLAHELMEILASTFAHGARYVPLDAVRDPALVPRSTALSLGLVETGERAAHDIIARYLAERHMLLVLDNMEQVIGAASPWLSDLIRRARRLTVLVTSRSPLNIDGEHQFIVPPLETPDTAPDRSPAVRLFTERAKAVQREFVLDEHNIEIVAEICRRLDGLPLAIELAAARIRILSPEALLARLTDRLTMLTGGHRDAPERLRSMRDAIGWSYNLLTPDERRLFQRLSVFIGSASLEAVEFVAAWPNHHANGAAALVTLQSLTDQSLVQLVPTSSGPRYRMLETIREYGIEQIGVDGIDDPYVAHADYVRDLARRAEPALMAEEQAWWLDQLEADFSNLRAAIDWLEQNGELEHAIEIIAQTYMFAEARGHSMDMLRWLEKWLLLPDVQTRSRTRANLLLATGALMHIVGDFDRGADLLAEAVDIFQDAGDAYHAAISTSYLGLMLAFSNNGTASRPVLESAIDAARATGHHRALTHSMVILAQQMWEYDETEQYRAYADEAYRIAQSHGDRYMMAYALLVSILDALHQGRLDDGERLVHESLRLRASIGATCGLIDNESFLAQISWLRGDSKQAEERFSTALRHAEETGHDWYSSLLSPPAAVLAAERGNWTRANTLLRTSMQGIPKHGRLDQLARTLAGYTVLASLRGDAVDAARFMGASETFGAGDARVRGEPEADVNTKRYEEAIVEAIGRGAFVREFHVGAAWSIEAAIEAGLAYSPSQSDTVAADTSVHIPDAGLSAREREVLVHIANGITNREVAESLFLSERTVEHHVAHILAKLELPSRTAAVAWAIRNGVA